jgi:DNA-binding transcriptional LysR family regulator
MEKIYYFLAIAEELNISRAAKRLFMSQQSLSTYLKKLEEDFGVLLVNRKPRLSLTPAGEVLLRSYQQMVTVEKNLQMELLQVSAGAQGHINLGMHSARSGMIMPQILSRFWKMYPNITFNIVDGLTHNFEDDLQAGELDFFIGVNPHRQKVNNTIPLFHEGIYVVISENLLMTHFKEEYPQCKERFKNGVDLKEFAHLPFILNNEESRVNIVLSLFMEQNDITLNTRLASNAGLLRIEMSGRDYGVSICTQMRLITVEEFNTNHPELSHLNAYPIDGLNDACDTYLVYNANIYRPKYMDEFLKIVVDCYAELLP